MFGVFFSEVKSELGERIKKICHLKAASNYF